MLTPKKQLFAQYYLANPNATEAAIKAGYSKKTAGSQGQRLLKDVDIADMFEKRVSEAIITADEILKDVLQIARTAEKDSDRLKGYEMLGKHLAMWTEKIDHGGKVEHNVTGEITARIEKAYGRTDGD